MKNIAIETLTTFEKWTKPTFQDVENIIENIDLSLEELNLKIGIDLRTLRRWISKKSDDRLEKSTIPYGVWCVLVALSEKKYIFGDIEKSNLSKIPKKYICTFENFESPPKEILISFVGKTSITGLTRIELCNLFGWNAAYLGREFNNGNIKYLNWLLLLVLVGVDINKLIQQ